jgi:hypothetical protein
VFQLSVRLRFRDPTTTFADIKKIMRLTQERIAARLKDDPKTGKMQK